MAETDIELVRELGRTAAAVVTHAKFKHVSASAAWLWLRALVYLTIGNGALGGVLTPDALRQLRGSLKLAKELCAAGLWRVDPHGYKMLRLSAPVPPRATLPPKPAPTKPGVIVITYDVDGEPAFWELTQDQVERWQKVYRTIDVLQQCEHAKAWVDANPSRRKTGRGMTKFLNSWLSRAVNDPRRHGTPAPDPARAGRTGAAPAGKYDHLSKTDDVES